MSCFTFSTRISHTVMASLHSMGSLVRRMLPRMPITRSSLPKISNETRPLWRRLVAVVEFLTVPRRLLGPRIVGVKSCTAFEAPAAVACDRACVDGRFRSQWPDSLRVGTRPATSLP